MRHGAIYRMLFGEVMDFQTVGDHFVVGSSMVCWCVCICNIGGWKSQEWVFYDHLVVGSSSVSWCVCICDSVIGNLNNGFFYAIVVIYLIHLMDSRFFVGLTKNLCNISFYCFDFGVVYSLIWHYKHWHYNSMVLWTMHVLFSSRFSSEEVSAQNQVKASVQRKIRQSIAEEVMFTNEFVTLYS